MLHFGASPKFNNDVKFIQIDIHPEEHHNNCYAAVSLLGHISQIATQLTSALQFFKYGKSSPYLVEMQKVIAHNVVALEKKSSDNTLPMSYHRAFLEIKNHLPHQDVVFISEGANTMDIARTFFNLQEPRCRLDAGIDNVILM